MTMKRGAHLTVAAFVILASCQTEQRNIAPAPSGSVAVVGARENKIVPGGPIPTKTVSSPAEFKAYDISEGQKLFQQYNCTGCHANGGGAIGPPLMETSMTYGNSPDNIYDSIVKGRPHGMPSWGGRIPEAQVWQIVAYVRSLSGLEPSTATSSRSDDIEKKTAAQLK